VQQKITYNRMSSIMKTTDHRRSSRQARTYHRKILRKKREEKLIFKLEKKRNIVTYDSGPRKYADY
jgi:hypothetical protein